jgi:hypothetical protein
VRSTVETLLTVIPGFEVMAMFYSTLVNLGSLSAQSDHDAILVDLVYHHWTHPTDAGSLTLSGSMVEADAGPFESTI